MDCSYNFSKHKTKDVVSKFHPHMILSHNILSLRVPGVAIVRAPVTTTVFKWQLQVLMLASLSGHNRKTSRGDVGR